MSNNGTGFWVMIGLIVALSCVALLEAALGTLRALGRHLAAALRRIVQKRRAARGITA